MKQSALEPVIPCADTDQQLQEYPSLEQFLFLQENSGLSLIFESKDLKVSDSEGMARPPNRWIWLIAREHEEQPLFL